MLSISMRPARLNQDYRGKTKEKEGEVTKLLSFGLDEIELKGEELCVITGEPHAVRALFNDDQGVLRPLFKCFKPFQFDDEIENAAVTIRLHGGAEYKLTGCKLTKIRAKLEDDGVTDLSMKVQCAPVLDKSLAELVANFGEVVDVEIYGVQEIDQEQLPLGASAQANGDARAH